MLRITKIAILILFIMVAFGVSYAQKPDTAKTDDKTDIKVLEERVKQNEAEIDDLLKDREERIENRINEFDEKLKEQKEDIKETINDKIAYVKDILNLYVFLGGLILTLLVSTISFIGYRRIITTIRKVIEQKTVAELEASWAESFEKFSKDRTKELENKWESRLMDLEKKWTDYDQSLKKAMAKIESQKGISSISDIPPEELNEFIDKLEQVKQEKEYSAHDWYIKAYSDGEKGNDEQAIKYYDEAIKLDPDYANAYNNRGLSYRKLEKYERAIEDYDKAIELNPEYANAFTNRGVSYHKLEKYERAIEDFDKAIELNPENASFYYNRGVSYDDLKKCERAIEDYDKAIELNPEDAEIYNNRGVSYYKLRKYERAIEDLNKAIQLDPKKTTIYINLTELRIIINEYGEALNILDKAIELSSELDEKAIFIYLKCVTLHLLNEETAGVEKELDEILAKDFTLEWDTDNIEEWLSKADLSEDTKKFIQEKTELLKKKRK